MIPQPPTRPRKVIISNNSNNNSSASASASSNPSNGSSLRSNQHQTTRRTENRNINNLSRSLAAKLPSNYSSYHHHPQPTSAIVDPSQRTHTHPNTTATTLRARLAHPPLPGLTRKTTPAHTPQSTTADPHRSQPSEPQHSQSSSPALSSPLSPPYTHHQHSNSIARLAPINLALPSTTPDSCSSSSSSPVQKLPHRSSISLLSAYHSRPNARSRQSSSISSLNEPLTSPPSPVPRHSTHPIQNKQTNTTHNLANTHRQRQIQAPTLSVRSSFISRPIARSKTSPTSSSQRTPSFTGNQTSLSYSSQSSSVSHNPANKRHSPTSQPTTNDPEPSSPRQAIYQQQQQSRNNTQSLQPSLILEPCDDPTIKLDKNFDEDHQGTIRPSALAIHHRNHNGSDTRTKVSIKPGQSSHMSIALKPHHTKLKTPSWFSLLAVNDDDEEEEEDDDDAKKQAEDLKRAEWIEYIKSSMNKEDEARVNRKILDLEISNASLLAVNGVLERTKVKQMSEIRELKRKLKDKMKEAEDENLRKTETENMEGSEDNSENEKKEDEDYSLETLKRTDEGFKKMVEGIETLIRLGQRTMRSNREQTMSEYKKVINPIEIEIEENNLRRSRRNQIVSAHHTLEDEDQCQEISDDDQDQVGEMRGFNNGRPTVLYSRIPFPSSSSSSSSTNHVPCS